MCAIKVCPNFLLLLTSLFVHILRHNHFSLTPTTLVSIALTERLCVIILPAVMAKLRLALCTQQMH